jgi:DNA-binding transcriptional ArsR family regulator
MTPSPQLAPQLAPQLDGPLASARWRQRSRNFSHHVTLLHVDVVKVIAEPRRRDLLRLCWRDERSAGELADSFDVTFGAVSQHLKVLRDAGLVRVRRDGNRRYYRADQAALGPLADYLEAMWADQLDTLASLAEAVEEGEK